MTKTGKSFELKVRDYLQGQVEGGSLGIDPKHVKVRHRPKYYSQKRKADITFDVSLEFYRQGTDEPYLIWIWECKDCEVPVDDIEEFDSKLRQLQGHKVKGSMATSRNFQRGVLHSAPNFGVGLTRFVPDGSIITLLEAVTTLSAQDVVFGLTCPETSPLRSMFYGLTDKGSGSDHLTDYLQHELSSLGLA